jgi:hypothetical protein
MLIDSFSRGYIIMSEPEAGNFGMQMLLDVDPHDGRAEFTTEGNCK